jgi:thioredoxin reductase (NADPH)
METENHFDVIVIGAGPAGLTAGIYLSRARMKTLIIDSGTIGGQMVLTHEIANYPGVESMSGYQLAGIMRNQAKAFGCKIIGNTPILDLVLNEEEKRVVTENGNTYTADAVILTPGGRPRSLNVQGENTFKGQGISYCATCDGDFFTDKEIVVVGGGNSALEEAVSLTRYASKVTLVHQFDHFQAFEYAIEEAMSHPKIDVRLESVITEFYGDERLKGAVIKNMKTGQTTKFNTDGVFIFIGYVPNTEMLEGKVGLNEWKEIIVDKEMATDIPGVFAAGDSIAKKYRQVTTAVGEATIAALAVAGYLHQKKQSLKMNLTV